MSYRQWGTGRTRKRLDDGFADRQRQRAEKRKAHNTRVPPVRNRPARSGTSAASPDLAHPDVHHRRTQHHRRPTSPPSASTPPFLSGDHHRHHTGAFFAWVVRMTLLPAPEVTSVTVAAQVVTGLSTDHWCASLREDDPCRTLRCRRSALSVPPEEYFPRPHIGRNTLPVSPNNALLRLGGGRPRFLVAKRTSARRPYRDDNQQPQHRYPGHQLLYRAHRNLGRMGRAPVRTLRVVAGGGASLRFRSLAGGLNCSNSTDQGIRTSPGTRRSTGPRVLRDRRLSIAPARHPKPRPTIPSRLFSPTCVLSLADASVRANACSTGPQSSTTTRISAGTGSRRDAPAHHRPTALITAATAFAVTACSHHPRGNFYEDR
jgi:hypothetical protein